MSKEQLLTILAITLAGMNLLLVGFLYLRPSPMGPPHLRGKAAADRFIKDKFKFDDAQLEAFLRSKDKHFEAINSTRRQLTEYSQAYYLLPIQQTAAKDSLLQLIQAQNLEIYSINNTHLEEIRQICRPDQLPYLKDFIKEQARSPNNMNRPPHRRRPPMN